MVIQLTGSLLAPTHRGGDRIQIRIAGDAEYDFRKLLYLGGTGKGDSPKSAGQFGEGSKIAAFLLLRDYEVDRVRFSSRGWVLDFYLSPLPEGHYDKYVRGLHVKLQRDEEAMHHGNYVEFVCNSASLAEEIGKARDLFYSSDNPHFHDPSFSNEIGGFSVLDPHTKGFAYEAGQRRHVTGENVWQGVDGLNIWLLQKSSSPQDRDRGAYSEYEMTAYFIKPLVESMTPDQITGAIESLRPIWEFKGREWENSGSEYFSRSRLDFSLLKELLRKAKELELQISTDRMGVAAKETYSLSEEEELLKNRGYRVYWPFFEWLGIPKAQDVFRELSKHYILEPTETEKVSIRLLRRLVDKTSVMNLIDQPPILLYSQDNEESVIQGQFSDEGIWMCQEVLNGGFVSAIMTYLHELSHKDHPDHNAEFSYTLGEHTEKVFTYLGNHLDEFETYVSAFKIH